MPPAKISFWLSRIQISPPVQKRIFRYQLHKLIWQAYKNVSKQTNQPFLFTLTGQQDFDGIYCLVQSREKPDWSATAHGNDTVPLKLKKSPDVKQVCFNVQIGDQFYFQLQACPIKNVYQGQNKRGLKRPIYDHIEIENWWKQRTSQHGFSTIYHEFTSSKILVRRKIEHNAKDISLSACRFSGLAEVQDEIKFAESILGGIGKKKIFGFGMLMLSSAS